MSACGDVTVPAVCNVKQRVTSGVNTDVAVSLLAYQPDANQLTAVRQTETSSWTQNTQNIHTEYTENTRRMHTKYTENTQKI